MSLDAWIETATSGLPPGVQARIRSEIEDHYASLLTKQLGAGHTQAQGETLALEQLGAAQEVSRSYRDACFSRERYFRGMWAVSGLLLIHLVNVGTWIITQTTERAGEYVYSERFMVFDKYLLPWNAVMSIVAAVCILIVVRGIGTLWRERYEINVARRVYWLLVIGVGGSALGMAVTIMLEWFSMSVAVNVEWRSLSTILEAPLWQVGLVIFSALRGLSPVVAGAALILFALTTWKSVYQRANRRAQILVLLTGVIGVSIMVNVYAMLDSSLLGTWRFYRYYTPYVTPTLMILLAVFLLLPLTTFRIMSQAGRTLEAGD